MERDQYDSFLDRCAREFDASPPRPVDGTREVAENICSHCMSEIPPACRYCPTCGEFQSLPEEVTGTFREKSIVKRHIAITLTEIESGVEIEGRMYTKVRLKVANLSPRRVHLSLTYVDSVLIDVTGRQIAPVDSDEFQDDPAEPVFPTWFYIYPEAYREGVLLFREDQVSLKRLIICSMLQENEDELFVFDLDTIPGISG